MLATGPLVGCAGADPTSAPADGVGGNDSSVGGGAGGVGAAGTPATNGGSSGTSAGSGGNPFSSNGNQGGFSFANGGNSTGTGTAGTSSGIAGAATAGTTGNNNSLTQLGNVSSVPIGGLVIAAGIFFVGRDAKGIYVMSMQCTHKGCAVAFAGSQLDCPCHHSRFDFNGNVLVGPATTQLPHFAAFVDAAGNISVDRYAIVSGSARVAV